MTERFIVDDAGTLIDMVTRKTYDYVSDICPVCNNLWRQTKRFEKHNQELSEENEQLKHYKEAYGDEIVTIKTTIKTMMENERTEIGKSVLKQLWEAIQ